MAVQEDERGRSPMRSHVGDDLTRRYLFLAHVRLEYFRESGNVVRLFDTPNYCLVMASSC